MAKIRLDTAAFRDRSAATAPQAVHRPDAATVDVIVEIKDDLGAVLLRVQASDGETWQSVGADLLEQGLTTIFVRESLLQRTASRFGMPAEDLLASLADSAVDVADASAGLPQAEHDALRHAGISLDGPPDDPSGAAQVAVGLARSRRFRDEALTVAQAATALGVTTGRVRQLVSAGTVVTMPGGQGPGGDTGYLLPAWQITDHQLLPGLGLVAAAASGVHPMTLAGFMTRPNPDLDVDDRAVAPVEWLMAGGDAQVVADLVTGLRVAA
ncbi:hypothetical protein [Nocardioides sp. GXZ039]|uniref:hypothetical protein n=1 Tax=Nocardioides sp. GXZ039 TaxID=3136018 RepID=UPI0030F395BA